MACVLYYCVLYVPLKVFKSSSEDELSEEEEDDDDEEEEALEPSCCTLTSALLGFEAPRLLLVPPDLSSSRPYQGRPGYIQADLKSAAQHVRHATR